MQNRRVIMETRLAREMLRANVAMAMQSRVVVQLKRRRTPR